MHAISEINGEEFDLDRLLAESIVVGPELEFLWDEIEIDADGQTSIAGLYVLGDAAGLAQGIIQAMMMGIRAGERIIERQAASSGN